MRAASAAGPGPGAQVGGDRGRADGRDGDPGRFDQGVDDGQGVAVPGAVERDRRRRPVGIPVAAQLARSTRVTGCASNTRRAEHNYNPDETDPHTYSMSWR